MKLRVAAIALSLTAVALFASSPIAFAEDDDKRPTSEEHRGPGHHEGEEELHERYGDVEQVNLPPLVVKEGIGQVDPLNSETLEDADDANPTGNLPVDPDSIMQNRVSPADNFFSAATIGLGVMGAGVLALGGVAVRRKIKLSKDPKADFLYQ